MSTALLLAEPQADTRGFLERHLTNDGFQVVDAETRPDLVLLGDTAALDACRARHGDVPVIVLGEPESDTVDRVRALDRGCDDFLAKPFAYEELLALVSGFKRIVISGCLCRFAARFPLGVGAGNTSGPVLGAQMPDIGDMDSRLGVAVLRARSSEPARVASLVRPCRRQAVKQLPLDPAERPRRLGLPRTPADRAVVGLRSAVPVDVLRGRSRAASSKPSRSGARPLRSA
jgi:hypothetical protein